MSAGTLTSVSDPLMLDRLDIPVEDVMTPGVVAISEEAPLRDVQRAMGSHGVHAVLVVGRRTSTPLGWATARGMLASLGDTGGVLSARDAVSEEARTIEPSASAREAIAAMSRAMVERLLVAAPGDAPVGVVSTLDVVRLAGR